MASIQTLFVSLLAVPAVLAAPSANVARSAPQLYSGTAEDFPAMSTWVDFDTILKNYTPDMLAAGDTQSDVDNIGTAVQNVASNSTIDPRVILSLIMQESTGYVGVLTTTDADGEGTGGLMQTSGCPGYTGQSGLTLAQITGMITCGTAHLEGNCKDYGGADTVDTYYPALREFNSGSVDSSGDLSVAPNGVGVASYVSDISQRLQGLVF